MATYVAYTPTSVIDKALFNFDAFGRANYKFSGTINISVSDAFTYAQYLTNTAIIFKDIYTSLTNGGNIWAATQLANIDLITTTFSNFSNLTFSSVTNYSGYNPFNVGTISDINVSLIYRTDLKVSGKSALSTDQDFGYFGSRGDIILNVNGLGLSGLGNDYSLERSTFGFHTLMHEIGHSLGLSHPHSSIVNGVVVLTTDYAATMNVGFEKLGFNIHSSADMNKEYFSIMSYDDETSAGTPNTFAQTPMILDVIALQDAYGEGPGSSGSGDNIIVPGATDGVVAFRTYFDTGGIDTIDLKNYATGVYLNMGTTIIGATHLVGVSMSISDANTMINLGGDPTSLGWFYGEYENALGSTALDVIMGNDLANIIDGQSGGDAISGRGGNDNIDGGVGIDTAAYSGNRSNYTLVKTVTGFSLIDALGIDGTDALTNIERLNFADTKLAIDLDITQSGGEVALLMGGVLPGKLAFDPSKQALLGVVIGLFDAGYSMKDLAGAVLRLPVWDILAGGRDNTHIAQYLLTNVNGFVPDQATLADAVTTLNTESFQGDWLANLSLTTANQAHIGLVGLAQTGLVLS